MTRLNYHSFFYILVVILFLSFPGFAQAPKSKGKYTKEIKEPTVAHITNEWFEGKFKRIRGRLFAWGWGNEMNGEIPYGAIISVYKITNDKSEFLFSYLVGADGKFNFKELKEGMYILKTGTTTGYNQSNLKILLAPRDKDSSDDDLEISLEVGT